MVYSILMTGIQTRQLMVYRYKCITNHRKAVRSIVCLDESLNESQLNDVVPCPQYLSQLSCLLLSCQINIQLCAWLVYIEKKHESRSWLEDVARGLLKEAFDTLTMWKELYLFQSQTLQQHYYAQSHYYDAKISTDTS